MDIIWPTPQKVSLDFVVTPKKAICVTGEVPFDFAQRLYDIAGIGHDKNSDYKIKFLRNDDLECYQSYTLKFSENIIEVIAPSDIGFRHGSDTLLQVLAYSRDKWPVGEIYDYPVYKNRSFMIDMGRSIYSVAMIKRLIRILSSLKYNQLHLHLYDDELCGIQFDGLPFGGENPFAISMNDLNDIIDYAQRYCIEVVPELEAWGHVGSIVYHRPELNGGSGVYNGSSFLICKDTFQLMRELITQVMAVMPKNNTIHLGLDEAVWYSGDDIDNQYSPTDLTGEYYDILQEIAVSKGKHATLAVWADHDGRPIPGRIKNNTIVMPWAYWIDQLDNIDEKIEMYSKSNMRWMAGAGQAGVHYRGAYTATKHWCKNSVNINNCEGINICFWEKNNLDENLITLFAGAQYCWNPIFENGISCLDNDEKFDWKVFEIMHNWQTIFKDAWPAAIKADRGDYVFKGHYFWNDKHGQPVAPTAPLANTLQGHDFANEHIHKQ